jgi:hypothetical protein
MAHWRSNIFSALFLLLGGSVFIGGDLLASAPARAEARSDGQIEDLYGDWKNVNPRARVVRRIAMTPGGSGVKVHVWGDCDGRECDWGASSAIVFNSETQSEREPKTAVHVKFESEANASHLIIMRSPRDKSLVVQVFNRDQRGRDRDHSPDEIRPLGNDNTYAIEHFDRTGDARPYADEGRRPQDLRPQDRRAEGEDRPGGRQDRYASGQDRYAGGEDTGGQGRYGDGRERLGKEPYGDRHDSYSDGGKQYDDHSAEVRDDKSLDTDGHDSRGRHDARREAGGRHEGRREDCLPFDSKRLDLSRTDGRWKIIDGQRWLFDFGHSRDAAEQALEVIRHYRLNQTCSLGRPESQFTYMLSSGEAPSGRLDIEDCDRFNPDRLDVRQIEGRYKIVAGRRELYDFGQREDEAQLALEIIQKHGFGAACYAGRDEASFRYLRR